MHYEFKIFPIGSGQRRLAIIREICECADMTLSKTAEKGGVTIWSAIAPMDPEDNKAFRQMLIEKLIPINFVSEYSKL